MLALRHMTRGLHANRSQTLRKAAFGSQSLSPVQFMDFLEIPKYASDPQQVDQKLDAFMSMVTQSSDNFLGYQVNESLPPIGKLSKLLEIHMNNAGDPFIDSYCKTHGKSIELAVLSYCAELWHDEPRTVNPNDPENYWGYVLNMGSTEGNLTALWNAREYLQSGGQTTDIDRDIKPMVFFSHDTHYSMAKSCDILGLQYTKIRSDLFGRIDVDNLVETVEQFVQSNAAKPRPIAVVYNMGTTFKGAYDECEVAMNRVKDLVDEAGVTYWNHLDGALGGFIVPFLRRGVQQELIKVADVEANATIPDFGFNLDIQSCNASFYKWFGAPYPQGVFMTQNKYLRKNVETPDYIGAPDTTLGGGRNAFSAAYIWWRLCLTDYQQEIASVGSCLENARYLEQNLKEMDAEFPGAVNAQRSPFSLSVTFNSPSKYISNKYSIPQEMEVVDYGDLDDPDDDVTASRSHIYCMKHVKREKLDRFLTDYRAFLKMQ